MPAIAVMNVEKRYRNSRRPALDGLNMEVGEGEILGLLGPNGAGKTTALSIISGLLRPTHGSVQVLGVDVTRHSARVKMLIGLVPQDVALYPTLTARENFRFFARMYGLVGKELKQRVAECLAVVGLETAADRRIDTFSGGMKRRANLAAALLHKPRLLILDEPTVGIDAQSRHMIFENLRARNREGGTIVYATHYMDEAAQMCSRVVILDDGRKLKEGAPGTLVAEQPGCANLDEVFLALTGRQLRD